MGNATVVTTVSTEQEVTTNLVIIVGMIGALCVGAAFAITTLPMGKKIFLKTKQPTKLAVNIPETSAAETVLYDRILVKYRQDITEETSASVSRLIELPRKLVRDRATGKIVPQSPEPQVSKDRKATKEPIQPKKVQRSVSTPRVKTQQQVFEKKAQKDPKTLYPSRGKRVAVDTETDDLNRWREIVLDSETDVTVLADELRQLAAVEDVQVVRGLSLFQVRPKLRKIPVDDPPGESFWPNDFYYTTHQQNPPIYSWGQSYPDQWGLLSSNFSQAWSTTTGSGVTVALIDSGIDRTHPELAGQLWTNNGEIQNNGIDDDQNGFIDDVNGWDFYSSIEPGAAEDNDPTDTHGHGTFVAGIIGAKTNNQEGIAGICWGCKLMAVKAAYGNVLTDVSVAQSIRYAVDNGADIINMSFGGWGRRPILGDAVRYAYEHGVVMVAAAGNGMEEMSKISPASRSEVISVGALNPDGTPATFSNYGKTLDLTAPGVDILSLRAANTDMYHDGQHIIADRYYRADGTSFAAPHVTGMVALMLSQNPNATAESIRTNLQKNARDLSRVAEDCSQYSNNLTTCGQHLACHVVSDSNGSRCENLVCLGRTAQQCAASDALSCFWDSFIHECNHVASQLPPPWVNAPVPYAAGQDVYTGYGALEPGSALTTTPGVSGTILGPYHGSRVPRDRLIDIVGLATGPSFQRYTLEWRMRHSATWQLLSQSTTSIPAAYSTLGTWNTAGLDGWYTLRLTVEGQGQRVVTDRDYYVVNDPIVDDLSIASGDIVGIDNNSLIAYNNIVGQVYGEFPNKVWYRRSIDNGQTFQAPVLVGEGMLSGYSMFFPSMAGHSPISGTVFVSWSENRLGEDGQYHHYLYLSRSSDNGQTFQEKIVMADHSAPVESPWEKPAVTVDSVTGDVYVASQDMRPVYDGTATAPDFYMLKSTDDGLTWGSEIVLAHNLKAEISKPFSIKAMNGKLHAVFIRQTGELYDVQDYAYYVSYTDASGVSSEYQFEPGYVDSFFSFFPVIDLLDANTILIGWTENWEKPDYTDVADVFLTRSTDGGQTFSAPTKVRTDSDADYTYQMFFPYIVHDASGVVYVSWVKYFTNRYDFPYFRGAPFVSRSFDGGLTFANHEQIGDQQKTAKAESTTAVASANNVFISWEQYDVEVLFTVMLDRTTACGEGCAAGQTCNVQTGICTETPIRRLPGVQPLLP